MRVRVRVRVRVRLTPLDGRLLFLRQDCDASDKDEADLALLGEQKLRNVALLAPLP